ncbi:MAG: methylmalonyl Co-A mutase-associated GTPase MeaB [Desulfomonilia bacterium]
MKRAMDDSWERLIEELLHGSDRALSRLITRVENRETGWRDALKMLYPHTGNASVFGITGSPGAGKSTLTNEIALRFANQGFSIGIIAVDPSSPFSGGALLGDRLRMRDISTRTGIFIRSMATRGVLGGLCQAAREVTRILDASGKDIVLIETVGVGQDEIEVVRAADTVMLICVPGQGDGIQAIKAGVMEIADLFVVNKADRDGAEEMASEISAMLELSSGPRETLPPVIMTSAYTKQGLDDLMECLSLFRDRGPEGKRPVHDLVREELYSLLEREVSHLIRKGMRLNGSLDGAIEQIMSGNQDPYTVVEELMKRYRLMDFSREEGGES